MTHRREVLGKRAGVEYGYNRFRANSRVFALTLKVSSVTLSRFRKR